MALHMTVETSYGAGETTVDMTALAVCQVRLRIGYSHPATLTWTMYAPNYSFPLGTRHFVKFWDDAGSNPFTGGTQSGPMAAGVRSIISTPSSLSLRLFSGWT